MTDKTCLAPHIVSQPGVRGGRPYIDGKGVTVAFVAFQHESLGVSVPEIASAYDLTMSEAYAALAFYYDNAAEIDRREEEDEVFAEELRRQNPSLLAAKLRALGA